LSWIGSHCLEEVKKGDYNEVPAKKSTLLFFLLKSRKNESNAHVEAVRILPPEGTCSPLYGAGRAYIKNPCQILNFDRASTSFEC
jgi:hypothetical protein